MNFILNKTKKKKNINKQIIKIKVKELSERLHGRKILGPKAICKYYLFFGHSDKNSTFTITTAIIINNIITNICIFFIFFIIFTLHFFLLFFVDPFLNCFYHFTSRIGFSLIEVFYCGSSNSFSIS